MATRQPGRNDRDMSETTTSELPTGGAASRPQRLVRTPDGKIAGVAAGIGHYVGVDPTIVRIAFVLLAFAGGIGILLYLVCWLVMPKGEVSARGDARRVDPWTIAALAALVLGVGLLFGWHGFDDGFQVVLGLALLGGGIWLLVRDRPPEGQSRLRFHRARPLQPRGTVRRGGNENPLRPTAQRRRLRPPPRVAAAPSRPAS